MASAAVVAALYENFDRSAMAIGVSMEMLNGKLNALEMRTNRERCFSCCHRSELSLCVPLRDAVLRDGQIRADIARNYSPRGLELGGAAGPGPSPWLSPFSKRSLGK